LLNLDGRLGLPLSEHFTAHEQLNAIGVGVFEKPLALLFVERDAEAVFVLPIDVELS